MATDIERLVSFEEAYYDQYDYYNLLEYSAHAGGKGRSKREIELNTNRHCPAGHERKIAEKYHNSQMKRRRTKSSSSWWLFSAMFTGSYGLVSSERCLCWTVVIEKQSCLEFVQPSQRRHGKTVHTHRGATTPAFVTAVRRSRSVLEKGGVSDIVHCGLQNGLSVPTAQASIGGKNMLSFVNN